MTVKHHFNPLWLLLLAMLSFAAALRAAEVVLASPGASPAPIMVAADATPSTRRAANELAAYIEKVCGQKPAVHEGAPTPLPESAIWVGVQPAVKALFPTTDFDFQHPEEILIAANEKHLVIAGRDRWDPEHPVLVTSHGELEQQLEYGTVNAIYTFLQDQLGVRWLWPGELGEDVVHRERIAFAPFEQRYHPRVFWRRGVMWWLCRPANRGKLSVDWSRRQRIYLDASNNLLTLLNEGHGFMDWWDRFHTTHPDYFAQQPDGTRSGFPGPDRVKMCLSNPSVAEQWITDVAQQIEKEPTKTFFNASENDNHLSGYCVCPHCEAWDSPRAPTYKLVWNGVSKEHMAMSDRQVRFANLAASKLRERFPGKGYKVVIYAYGPSASAPMDVKPDADVIVAHVPNMWEDLRWEDQWSVAPVTSARQITDWTATGAKLVWRPNLHSYAGLYQGLPDVPLERAAACFHHVMKDNHALGVGFAHTMNFWPTQGPLYYLLAQLAWNPDLDEQAVLKDYYERGFGPAAPSVKAYWSLMESTRNQIRDEAIPWMNFPQRYDESFFKRAGDLLDQADQQLVGKPDIYRQRVAFVRSGLAFTQKIIALRHMKNRYVEGGRKEDAMAAELRTGIAALERMANGSTESLIGPVLPPQFLPSLQPETIEKFKEERKDLQ